jgi:hypothetical protein
MGFNIFFIMIRSLVTRPAAFKRWARWKLCHGTFLVKMPAKADMYAGSQKNKEKDHAVKTPPILDRMSSALRDLF